MRLHDESVFDMIDPALKPSVETWFQTHEPIRLCAINRDIHLVTLVTQTVSLVIMDGYVEHYCDIARDNEFWNYIFFLV